MSHLKTIADAIRDGDIIVHHKDGSAWKLSDDDRKLVAKTLEKDVPVIPGTWHNRPCGPDFVDDDWGYTCPNCENDELEYEQERCSCGQLLDWDGYTENILSRLGRYVVVEKVLKQPEVAAQNDDDVFWDDIW